MNNNLPYSPHDLLPAPNPKTSEYPLEFFYEKVAKHLIKDTVRVMDNGLHIDLDKVIKLEEDLVVQLKVVEQELMSNSIIERYLKLQYKREIEAYKADRKEKTRDPSYYEVPFKYKDMVHRSYFMDEYAKEQGWSSPEDRLPTGVGKWPVKLVKTYAKSNMLLTMMLEDRLPENTPALKRAMSRLFQDKADMYNEKYLAQYENPEVPYPKFNPSSPKQKQELFNMLGIESEEVSKKTGLPKWDREQIELVHKRTVDPEIKEFTQSFIDYSFAAIIKNNFIEAFYNYTVDGRLYGQYKLLGAKSGRYTSSNPNMLNLPSTGSRFAKPVKKCLTAPKGKIIVAADYSALEDRVIASLSEDTNKCNIFLKDLDGHSLNALGYFPEKVGKVITLTGDTTTDTKAFKQVVDDETHPLNSIAKAIRQDSKGPTFGLAYGAFPPKVASSLKIPLAEAEVIFNNYHNVLYPGITDYRENYVLKTANKEGQIHLGLGFMLKTDNASNDIRTLANATCQFWSILTALTINKMHSLIDNAGYQDDVKIVSSIYDSIYLEVTEDTSVIKWVNDNLIRTMLVDFMEDQTIPNDSASDLGYDWADMIGIPNEASIKEIEDVLIRLKQKQLTN